MVNAVYDSTFEPRIAGEVRTLNVDAGFVSQEWMFAGRDDQTFGRTRTACKIVGREVGHDDIAIRVIFGENDPEVASFIETEESVAWVHEAWA